MSNESSTPGLIAPIVIAAVVAAITLIVLRSFPEIDISVASWFYTPGDCWVRQTPPNCGRFELLHDYFWRDLRAAGYRLPSVLAVFVAALLIYLLFRKKPVTPGQIERPVISLLSVLAAPILLVNIVLKDNWGRPRPYQTELFGGEFPYVPPGTISDYCDNNCSFVSGEASMAFWMLTLVLFVPQKWKITSALVITLLASAISILRVAFGRHYLSDIVLSASFTIVVIALIIALVRSGPGKKTIRALTHWSNQRRIT